MRRPPRTVDPLSRSALLVSTSISRTIAAMRFPGTRSRRAPSPSAAYEIAYLWGMGGTLQALLTPEMTDAFPHPTYLSHFVPHGALLVAISYATLALGMRPVPFVSYAIWYVPFWIGDLRRRPRPASRAA